MNQSTEHKVMWTELRDSLTEFYENILKKSCAGGRPAAKALSSKFVTKTAFVPYPPVVPCPYPLTTPTPTPSSSLPMPLLPPQHCRRPLRRSRAPPKTRR